MHIYLMRHCTSDDGHAMDPARPLTPVGKAEARMIGRFFRDAGIHVDLILSSDFLRAKQTAKRIARRIDRNIVYLPELRPDYPDRNVMEQVWSAVEKARGDADHLLIVTHGPLIQDLRDYISGDPVGASRYGEHWIHGSVAKIEDGRQHWVITPKLLAKINDETGKLKEGTSTFVPRGTFRFAEHLLTASRKAVLNPLIQGMARVTRMRFRAQGRAVVAAVRSKLAEADQHTAAPAITAALGGFTYAAWLKAHGRVSSASYAAGGAAAASDLDYEGGALGKWQGDSDAAATALDQTTHDRLLSVIDGLDGDDLVSAIAKQFQDWQGSRSDTVALSTVAGAFGDGQIDGARAISLDTGDDVEKRWNCEPDACDDCQDAADEDWVDIDFVYPSVDVGEPDAHPNCQCDLEMRRAEK